MVRRRSSREPVARIIGERGFYGRNFAITQATLDPRPDSETLITAALELADAHGWRDTTDSHSRRRHRLGVSAGHAALRAATGDRARRGY